MKNFLSVFVATTLCLALLAGCGDGAQESGGQVVGTGTTTTAGSASAAGDPSTTAGGEPSGTTTGNVSSDTTTLSGGNGNYGQFFEDETTGQGGQTAGGTTAGSASLSTTAPTTAQPTTKPPTTAQNGIKLPGVGYDPNGQGRIKVAKVEVKGTTVTFTVKNATAGYNLDDGVMDCEFYNADGEKIEFYNADGEKTESKKLYLSYLKPGQTCDCSAEIPNGTVEIKLTNLKVDEWNQWIID